MSFAVLAHAHADLAQNDVAGMVGQRIGQPLRRAGMLTGMALLACLDVLNKHARDGASPAPSTALLWHSVQGPQPETEALLAAQRMGDGLLMPFEFLASQPSLLCPHLKPWVPGLEQALFLPCTAHPQEQPWLQALQLADAWLAQGRYQRVICASLNRDAAGTCGYAAISLASWPACHDAIQGRWLRPGDACAAGQVDAENGLWNMLHDPHIGETLLATPWACLHLQRQVQTSPVPRSQTA